MFASAVMMVACMCVCVLAANISQTAYKCNQDYTLTINGSYSNVLTCTGTTYAYTAMENNTGILRYIETSVECWDNGLARTTASNKGTGAVANSTVSSGSVSRGKTSRTQVFIHKGILHGGSIATTPVIDTLTYTVRQNN